ncbi:MAG: LD-carboxypeptidase [Ignavibacteria bacterium]|nr:LD-carboxypeptidase [Ignavibacteria bacterium]
MFSRRSLLSLLGLSILELSSLKVLSISKNSSNGMTLIKPNSLKENDIVGVVAPGTAVPSPDDLFRAKEILSKLNLRAKFSSNISKGTNYRTRSIQERLDDLMNMFLDKDVRAIFCIRGGYGSGQLLDKIDYSIIRNNPKIFVGYSDITALHIAFNKFARIVTFHGPVLLSPFSRYTFELLRNLLFGKEKQPKIQNPFETETIRSTHYIRTIKTGKAQGIVVGGNLSIICSLLGTPFEYDFNDTILVLEDVQEEPYRIDRMLNQLRLAGIFKKVNGLIFGECNDCVPSTQNVWDFSLGEVLDNYFSNLNKPSFYGLCIGHTSDQATFPIGVAAEIDAEKGTLTYLDNILD